MSYNTATWGKREEKIATHHLRRIKDKAIVRKEWTDYELQWSDAWRNRYTELYDPYELEFECACGRLIYWSDVECEYCGRKVHWND